MVNIRVSLASHPSQGLCSCKKCPVHPVSAMAVGIVLVGGQLESVGVVELILLLILLLLCVVAPTRQYLLLMAIWLPPMVLQQVASFLCPSRGKWQEELLWVGWISYPWDQQ